MTILYLFILPVAIPMILAYPAFWWGDDIVSAKLWVVCTGLSSPFLVGPACRALVGVNPWNSSFWAPWIVLSTWLAMAAYLGSV